MNSDELFFLEKKIMRCFCCETHSGGFYTDDPLLCQTVLFAFPEQIADPGSVANAGREGEVPDT